MNWTLRPLEREIERERWWLHWRAAPHRSCSISRSNARQPSDSSTTAYAWERDLGEPAMNGPVSLRSRCGCDCCCCVDHYPGAFQRSERTMRKSLVQLS